MQSQLERLVAKNYYLHQSAREAYRGYLLSYNSHQMKDAFNVHTLDLAAVAKSFGFTTPPKVGRAAAGCKLFVDLVLKPTHALRLHQISMLLWR